MNFRTFLVCFCVCILHRVSAKRSSNPLRYGCTVCQHGGSNVHLESIHACRRPPPPTPGYISCTYDAKHMKCKGECPSGYKFPDGRTEIEIQCSTNDAIWYPIRNFPDCISQNHRPYDQPGYQPSDNLNDHSVTLSRCKRPNAPAYGIIRCFYDSENLVCTARCDAGYYFPGGQAEMQLQCNLIKAIWYPTNTVPDCLAWNQNSGNSNQDYQGSNSEALALTLNRCRRPPSPAPGRISCTYDHSKMTCVGTCDTGYYFPNGRTEMTLQCYTRDAYWYPLDTFPKCVTRDYVNHVPTSPEQNEEKNIYAVTLIRCRKPEAPEFGVSQCKYDSVSMNCTGTCRTGYYFPNGKREMLLQCRTENGVWFPRGEYPACSQFDSERYTDTSQQRQEEISHQLALTLNKCGRKEAPAAGYVNCKYDALGMNCTGTCRTGYYFPGGRTEIIIRCNTINGYWYPRSEFPACSQYEGDRYTDTTQNDLLEVTLRKCGMRSAPAAGYVNCKYDALRMNCTGTCATGYYFPGRRTEIILQCYTENGYWYPRSEFPSCSRHVSDYEGVQTTVDEKEEKNIHAVTLIRCRKPTAPGFGTSFCKYDSISMNCTGTCNVGYYFPNGRREMVLQCRTENGIWFPRGEYPACTQFDSERYTDSRQQQQRQELNRLLAVTVSKCGRRDAPIAGYVDCNYDTLGMNCTGTCRTGYYFPGGRTEITLHCKTENGYWYPRNEFPSCTRYDSEKVTDTSQQRPQEVNSRLEVTLSKCRRKEAPVAGYVNCKYDALGMNCTGTCRTGYYFPGRREEIILQCRTENGYWYPRNEFPSCTRYEDENSEESTQQVHQEENALLLVTLNKCSKRSAPSSGYVNCKYNALGMNCTGTCRRNYYFPGGRTELFLQCKTENGIWYPQGEFPACSFSSYETGSEDITNEDKQLQESEYLKETVRRCGRKTAPGNGHANCTYDALGMNCTATCKSGYYFPDGRREMIIRCRTNNAVWYPQSEFPHCSEYDSGRLTETVQQQKNEKNLTAETLRRCIKRTDPVSGYSYCRYDGLGMNCTGRCRRGYYFPDGKREMTLRCFTENGFWYPLFEFPSCSQSVASLNSGLDETTQQENDVAKNKCIAPPSPLHGYISCSDDTVSRNMTCVGRCKLGYLFPNGEFEMTLKCSKEEVMWHPLQTFPDCTFEVKEDENEKPIQDNLGIESDYKCGKKPNPPLTGYLSCLNYSHALECTGTCMPDYTFSTGNSAMTLTCSFTTGQWSPLSYFPPCYLKESIPDTSDEESLQPGDINPSTNVLCAKPLTPKGGYIHCEQQFSHGYRRCTGTCMPGFSFPNGENTMTLRCSVVRGWLPYSSFPSCKENKDEIYHPDITVPTSNNQNENVDVTGTVVRSVCRQPLSPNHGYIYCVPNADMLECTAKCTQGFRFPSGETRLVYRCDNKSGRWNPRSQFPDCVSACDIPCNNGGVCVRPNQCFCPQDYRGNFCQYPLSNCDPQNLKFAGSMRCNHTTEETICSLGCPQRMILEPSYDTVRCSLDGTWTPRHVPRCVEDPRYRDVDLNGHLCPTSQCSPSSNIHEGSLCHRPPPPKPGYIRCVYNRLMMECTSKCADGYRYPNGAREQIRTCDNRTGIWTPREQYTDCEPICDRECQNGGRCLAPNFCYCPVKYRGNQCQYPLSNCDPHRLRFAGSIRCSHSSEETICKLGCPDGTVLDNPSYDTVRCNLVGEWTPRYVPRCVEANIPRRPIYSDSEINRDYHQEYTHTTQNNYEQRYQESQIDQQRLNYQQQLQQRNENLNQRSEHQKLTNVDSSDKEQFGSTELEKESYEQRLKQSQEEEQRRLYDKILKQHSMNHSDYNYQQRQNMSHLLDRMKEEQQTESAHSESNEFDSFHQKNHEHFKDYEKLQTNMNRFGYTPSDDKYSSTSTDTQHTGEEEIRGYGHRFYHQRINQSESGTYREHSAQQHHYFHQYQRTGHKNTDKHSCILCTTG